MGRFGRNVLWNVSGNSISQGATVVQELFVRSVLPPAAMGAWELANLVRRVGNTVDLGFLPAAQRLLPRLGKDGRSDQVAGYRNTALSSQMVTKAVVAITVIAYVLLVRHVFNVQSVVALLAASVLLVLYAISDSVITFLQTAERYAGLSKGTVIGSFLTAAVVIGGTWRWGLPGLIVGNIIGLTAYVAILLRVAMLEHFNLELGWKLPVFRDIVSFGAPIRAADFPLGILADIDMMVVTASAGVSTLAVYGTAKVILNQLSGLVSWLALVMIVRLNHQSDTASARQLLGSRLEQFLDVVNLVLLPVAIVGACVGTPAILAVVAPKYLGAMSVLPVLLPTLYFMPQTTVVRNIWLLDRKFGRLALSNIWGLAATALTIVAIWRLHGLSPRGIALGYLLGNAMYYVWLMSTAGVDALGGRRSFGVAVRALGSAAYTMWLVNTVIRPSAPLAWNAAVAGALAAGVGVAPVICWGIWRSGLHGYVASMFASTRTASEAVIR
jgi:O-antigen/teichoic acid export membrane protein